ncbi:MAG: ABC transporter permease [Isosphaeraceae bacterium]|nr:ABC transporter permease [Isosphaeraceae bacterium]
MPRLGTGPVFAYEWLITARKWQIYALRSLYVAVLLAGLALVWRIEVTGHSSLSVRAQAAVGQLFFRTIVLIQLVLVLLATPAATAGVICQDKARGTLLHLLVTDLSDAEIVLGKLAARLVPVLGLLACTLPVTALGTLLGGIDPVHLTGAFLITAGMALVASALALALSVWGRKVHEVLLVAYLVLILWSLLPAFWQVTQAAFGFGWRVPWWTIVVSPFALVIGPINPPSGIGLGHQVIYSGACLLVAMVLAALAIWRIRAVVVRQAGQATRERRGRRLSGRMGRWLPHRLGPSLDDNPILWREWHRNRPTRWTRVVWAIYITGAAGFSLVGISGGLSGNRMNMDLSLINGCQAAIGMLLLSMVAATRLAEERVRGSLDVVLATPLATRTILWGQWWSAFRSVPPLVVLPGLVATALAYQSRRWIGPPLVVALILAYGAALTSLGLALATWIRRLGRAVTACVAIDVLVTIGAIVLAFLIFRQNKYGQGLAMASPFWGIGFFSDVIMGGEPAGRWPYYVAWAIVWIAVYTGAAIGLWFATLRTFDRCLGRMPEGPDPPPRRHERPLPWAEVAADVAPDLVSSTLGGPVARSNPSVGDLARAIPPPTPP